MKKILIGILLFPLLIFIVGAVVVVGGKSLNLFPQRQNLQEVKNESGLETKKTEIQTTSSPAPRQLTAPITTYGTKYYAVSGSTRDEIEASMTAAKRGTFLEGHSGATTAETHINFSRRQLAKTCEATMTQFNLTLTYTYPKWTASPASAPELVEKWNAFIAALIVHEQGHAQIEVKRAAVVMQELQNLPAYATCEAFDAAWQAKASALDEETTQIERQYDRDTQGGKTQGVIF